MTNSSFQGYFILCGASSGRERGKSGNLPQNRAKTLDRRDIIF
ncbi:hypothetical protein [Oscillospiraceae bacterium]|nr:hypothetical protein [Oscillospiraceae bacterium]